MSWFVSSVMTGMTAFVATNIDDIVILMLFFSRGVDQFHPRQIVLGQYLGFLLLLSACIPGFVGGLLLPKPWIGLLGFLPIVIGLKQLLAQEDEEESLQAVSDALPNRRFFPQSWQRFWQSPICQVAAVTVANGGDNIGIYVPLFASSSLNQLGIIIVVFLLLIAVWCAIAAWLARHQAISPLLNRYAHVLTPLVLIGLGIYILLENHSYRLLSQLGLNL